MTDFFFLSRVFVLNYRLRRLTRRAACTTVSMATDYPGVSDHFNIYLKYVVADHLMVSVRPWYCTGTDFCADGSASLLSPYMRRSYFRRRDMTPGNLNGCPE